MYLPPRTPEPTKPKVFSKTREEYREKWISHRAMISLIKLYEQEGEDPGTMARVNKLVESEQRITKLAADLEHLKELAGYTGEHAP